MILENDSILDEKLRAEIYSFREEGGRVYLTFLNEDLDRKHNLRIAELLEEDFKKLFKEKPGEKFGVLVDFRPLNNKVSYLPRETRDVYTRLLNQPQVARTAVFGISLFYETAVRLMIAASRDLAKTKIFKTREEAMAWLDEK